MGAAGERHRRRRRVVPHLPRRVRDFSPYLAVVSAIPDVCAFDVLIVRTEVLLFAETTIIGLSAPVHEQTN